MKNNSLIKELEEIIKREEHLYIIDRPVQRFCAFTPTILEDCCNKLLTDSLTMEKKGAKLLVIPYDEIQEDFVLLILLILSSRLRHKNKQITLLRPIEGHSIEIDGKQSYLILHNATRFSNFIEVIENPDNNEKIIATIPRKEWVKLIIRVPYIIHKLEDIFSSYNILSDKENVIQDEKRRLVLKHDSKDAYSLVASFDSFGIPLPFELFVKALGEEEEKAALMIYNARGLLYWVERERPPALLVSTKGEAIAYEILKDIPEEEILKKYEKVVQAIDSENKEERYTIMKLFNGFIQKSKKLWAKQLITCEEIRNIWMRGNSAELLAWGKVYEELMLFKQSEQVFLKGLEEEPQNIYLLHAYARMLGRWAKRKADKYEEAKKRFEAALRINDKNIYVWHSMAEMEKQLGNFDEAELYFRHILDEIDETNIYALISYADLEAKRWHESEAVELLNQVLKIEPHNLYALHIYGEFEAQRLNYGKAEQYFNQVLQIDPQNVPTLHTLGVMHKNRGHFKKAEMVLRKSLEIAPENEYSLQTLGELLGEREQYDEAIEKFDKVLKLDPEHIETLVAWGELEAKRKNYPKAYELFARAKEINPQNIRVYGAWGEAKLKEGKLDEAEDLLYKAMLQDGDKIPAWNISGKLKAEQNDLDKAREFFRMSLRSLRDVKSLEKIITLNTWIEVELKYGDIEKAKWLLEKSLDLDGENNYTKEKAKRIRQKL